MAKVSEQVAAAPLVAGGETALHSHAGGAGEAELVKVTAEDVTNATVTFANVTGLTFEMLANKTYIIEAWLIFQSSATATGAKFALNSAVAPAALAVIYHIPIGLTLYASCTTRTARAYNAGVASVEVDTTDANILAKLEAVVKNGASAGTLAVRFACEVATSPGVTVKAGSVLRYRQVD